jgi:3-deoxy-manno-octulosonate cytidylyltransferase (CMP-KDO synthetase)
MREKALIVIPARMGSTRFPGKPLATIAGKTMIERVWAIGMATGEDVVIATDTPELAAFAKGFGSEVVMTSSACLTGTDRVAEVAQERKDHQIFFSLQGDAVLTPPWVISDVLKGMLEDPSVVMATPAVRLVGAALTDFIQSKERGSSSGTAVTFNRRGDALYFSKALIPYARGGDRPVFRHIGLYGYRRETLLHLGSLPEGLFEKAEKLEQLRALENGIAIRVVEVDYRGRTHSSVDLPEDVGYVESLIAKEGELLCLNSF